MGMNLVTKHALVLGVSAVAAAGALAGCSTSKETESGAGSSTSGAATSAAPTESGTAAPTAGQTPGAPAPGTGHVKLNAADLGPVTGVSCQTADGVVTIAIESTPKTTVVLTDEETPGVNSVSIGELGAEGPSVAYVPGLSEATPQATRDGKTYTVTGSGKGTDATDPSKPADLPFEIAATCP